MDPQVVTPEGSTHFPGEGHSYLTSIEEASFWFRARNRLIIDLLRRYGGNFRSLLEVGCGTGFVLKGIRAAFPSARLVGVEALATGLQEAVKRLDHTIELSQADILRLSYEGEFDVVGAFDVLEHIDDDRAALSALTRAVLPGGVVLLTVPQHPWLWSAADEIAQHRRRYRRGELEEKASTAGLDVVMTTSFVCSLLPAMMANRLLGPVRPEDEHVLPRVIGGLFEAILGCERRLIALRVGLPVGGTRVVVARRAGLD